jgi:hypothetical protein
VTGKFLGIPKRMVISDVSGQDVAQLSAKAFSLIKDKMNLEVMDGPAWALEGSFIEKNYNVTSEGRTVVQITQKWVAIRDQYPIDSQTASMRGWRWPSCGRSTDGWSATDPVAGPVRVRPGPRTRPAGRPASASWGRQGRSRTTPSLSVGCSAGHVPLMSREDTAYAAQSGAYTRPARRQRRTQRQRPAEEAASQRRQLTRRPAEPGRE